MGKDQVIFVDSSSILISTDVKLIRIRCPFKVICVMEVNEIKSGQIKSVWSVYPSEIHRLLYLIDNKLFVYSYFRVSS